MLICFISTLNFSSLPFTSPSPLLSFPRREFSSVKCVPHTATSRVMTHDTCVCLHAIFLQGQDPRRPLVIGVGASSWLFPTKGATKQAAPTRLRQALSRGVLRGSGGTQHLSVIVTYLSEYRTTVCCSKCGARTTAPHVSDYRTYRSTRGSVSAQQLQTAGARG